MAEEEYSLERFVDVLKTNKEQTAKEIVDAVMRGIDAFVGEAPQFDDITLMVMKRL